MIYWRLNECRFTSETCTKNLFVSCVLQTATFFAFQRYNNQYTSNPLSKSPYLRAEERHRAKYMAGRFLMEEEGEFKVIISFLGCLWVGHALVDRGSERPRL